jgi:hypothetical protein
MTLNEYGLQYIVLQSRDPGDKRKQCIMGLSVTSLTGEIGQQHIVSASKAGPHCAPLGRRFHLTGLVAGAMTAPAVGLSCWHSGQDLCALSSDHTVCVLVIWALRVVVGSLWVGDKGKGQLCKAMANSVRHTCTLIVDMYCTPA